MFCSGSVVAIQSKTALVLSLPKLGKIFSRELLNQQTKSYGSKILKYFSTLKKKDITFWQSNLMIYNPNCWRLPIIINSFFAVVSLVQFSAAVCHQRRCLVCDLNAVMISQVAMISQLPVGG